MDIDFQNENIRARKYLESNKRAMETMAVIPDLICVVNTETYLPLLSEDLKYGLRVSVIYLPCPIELKKGIHLCGPHAFGFDEKYDTGKESCKPKSIFDEF